MCILLSSPLWLLLFVLFCFVLFEYPLAQTNSLLRVRRAQSRTLPICAWQTREVKPRGSGLENGQSSIKWSINFIQAGLKRKKKKEYFRMDLTVNRYTFILAN